MSSTDKLSDKEIEFIESFIEQSKKIPHIKLSASGAGAIIHMMYCIYQEMIKEE